MRLALFPCIRTVESFEFDVQPSIDPGQIIEMETSRWIANGDSLVRLAPPGVEKTHLEVVLGQGLLNVCHSKPG